MPPKSGARVVLKRSVSEARGLLLIIGALTIVVNAFQFSMLRSNVEDEIRKVRDRGAVVDDSKVDAQIRSNQLLLGGLVALGLVFVGLGLAVEKYPVPITVTAFSLYMGVTAALALLDPITLLDGMLFKIICILGLAEAIRSAVAFHRYTSRKQADAT